MRCLILVLVSVSAFAGPAMGQRAPSREGEEEDITVNMDALGLPEPAPIPEIPPEEPGARKPALAADLRRSVPLPRPKPDSGLVAAANPQAPVEPGPAPSDAEVVARTKPKADLPVAMMEKFPVELRGTARDPFPNARVADPAAGLQLLGRIRFSGGENGLPADATAPLDALAERIAASKGRIRIVAYSGRTGDMSSQARRLSLERARAVRDHFVARGISFERIDIMPFGGPATGETDRVDVLSPPG